MDVRGLITLQVEVYLLTDNSCQNLAGVLTCRRVPTPNLVLQSIIIHNILFTTLTLLFFYLRSITTPFVTDLPRRDIVNLQTETPSEGAIHKLL